jgi:transcription elongation GreA/GreB family factor
LWRNNACYEDAKRLSFTKIIYIRININTLIKTKQQLYALCRAYIEQRIATAQDAIRTAQSSANEETKSSAGDKYETGRAMMQLEIEKNTIQLAEAQKLKQLLEQIDPERKMNKVQLGSLVITDQGNFYIAISVGQLQHDGKTYFAIAPTSPIGLKLNGHMAGDVVSFNSKNYSIKEIW